jgi:5-methylcytosine-specific restriction enzyme A
VKPRIKTITNRIETADLSRGARIQTERIRGHKLTVIRQRILLRDEYTCQICGRVSAQLEVDHIVPLSMGGNNSISNLQSLCKTCHKLKSDRDRG